MLDDAESIDASGGSDELTVAEAPAVAGHACVLALAGVGAAASAFAFAAVWSARLPRGGSGGALRLGLLSLSASDALVSLCTAALLVIARLLELPHADNADEESRHRRESCAYRAVGWVFGVAAQANLHTLVFLAAQQFVATHWPLRSAGWLTARCCRVAIACVWLMGLAFGFAPAVLVAAVTDAHPQVNVWTERGTTRLCYQLVLYHHRTGDGVSGSDGGGGSDSRNSTPEVTTEQRRSYTFDFGQRGQRLAFVAHDSAFAGLALAALAISYGYILAVLDRRRRAPLSAECEKGGAKATVLAKERTSSACGVRLRERKRCVVVIMLVTLVCLVCYAPQFVFRLMRELEASCPSCPDGGDIAPSLYYVTMAAACVAPVANPLIYTLRLRVVRDAAAALLARCCCCRSLAASLRAAGERHRSSGSSSVRTWRASRAAASAARSSASDSVRTRSTDCSAAPAAAVSSLAQRSSLESGRPTTDDGRPLLVTPSQEVQPTEDISRTAVMEACRRTLAAVCNGSTRRSASLEPAKVAGAAGAGKIVR